MKKHKLGVVEDQSENMAFVLADRPYNIPSSRQNKHAEYDVFILNDMKDGANNLEDVMTPGAREYVFYPALQFVLW